MLGARGSGLPMKIAIGSDHVDYPLKKHIISYLSEKGYECTDFGTHSEERTDYPIYGKKVAGAVMSGEYEKGILIYGTGVGISISANKVKGIRAVVCSEPYSARLARQHNNANIVAWRSISFNDKSAFTRLPAFQRRNERTDGALCESVNRIHKRTQLQCSGIYGIGSAWRRCTYGGRSIALTGD